LAPHSGQLPARGRPRRLYSQASQGRSTLMKSLAIACGTVVSPSAMQAIVIRASACGSGGTAVPAVIGPKGQANGAFAFGEMTGGNACPTEIECAHRKRAWLSL